MSNDHTHNSKVVNRLARLAGHVQSVRRMVEEGRDCTEILTQISAIRAALNSVGRIFLEDHINHCLVKSLEENDRKILQDLNMVIGRFLK